MALVLAGAAHLPAFRARVLDRLLSWANGRFGLDARVTGLDYNLFTLKFTLSGVSVAARHAAARPFFSADRVEVELPWSALAGSPRLNALRIDRPRLDIATDTTDRLNLPTVRGGPGERPSAFTIDDLVVRDMTVKVDDEVRHVTIDLQRAFLRIAGGADGSFSGRLRMSTPGALAIDRWHTTVTRLDGTIAVRGGRLHLNPLTIATSDGELSLEGTTGLSADAPLELSVGAQLHVARIARTFIPAFPLTGTLQLSGRLDGSLAAPHGALSVKVPGLVWRTLAPATLAGSLDVSRHHVEFTALRLDAPWGHGTLRGRISDADAALPSRLDVTWHDVDAAATLEAAEVDLPLRVASVAEGSGAITWTGGNTASRSMELRVSARPDHGRGIPIGGTGRITTSAGVWTIEYDLASQRDLRASGQLLVDRTAAETALRGRSSVSTENLASAVASLRRAGLEIPAAVASAVRGHVAGDITFGGTTESPHIEIAATGDQVAFEPLPAGRADARLVIERGRVRVAHASLAATAGTVTTDGLVIATSGAVDGEVSAELTDVAPVLQALLPSAGAISGAARVRGRVSGTLSHPDLDLHLEADRVAAAGQHVDRVEGRVTWREPHLEWADVRGRQGTGSVTTRGTVDVGTRVIDLAIEGGGLTVAECPSTEALCEGGIAVQATLERVAVALHGPARQPSGSVSAAASSLRWGGSDVGRASVDATLTHGVAAIRAAAPDLALSVTGTFSLPSPSPFELTLAASGTQASRVLSMAGRPALAARVDASLSGTIHAAGDLEHLSDIALDAVLPASSLVVDGRRWSTGGPARVAYGPARVAVSGLSLTTGASRLSADGALSSDGAATLAIDVDGRLEDLPDLPFQGAPGISGRVTAQLRVTGPPTAPRMAGDAAVTSAHLVRPGVTVAVDELAARVKDGFVSVDRARVSAFGAHAIVSGALPVALFAEALPSRIAHALGDSPAGSRATLGADVSWTLADTGLLSDTGGPLHGSLQARVDVEADRLDVSAIRGAATVQSAELAVGNSRITQAAEARLSLADRRVALAPWRVTGAGTDVVAQGSLRIDRDGTFPVEASVRGPLTIEPLQAFLGVPISGTLATDVRISGSAIDPVADGTITVSAGALRVRSPRVALADVAGSIRLAGRTIDIGSIAGLVNGAPFTVSGAFGIPGEAGPAARTIRLQAQRVPIQPFATGPRAEADVDLLYSDEGEKRTVTGHVELLPQPFRGSVLALRQFVDSIAAANAPLGEPRRQRRPGTSPVKLDIGVTSREPLLVDTSAGRVELAANLSIAGSMDQPSLLGRITILDDGVIRAGGRTYTIANGSIDFTNPRRVVPVINLTATTKISTYAITMVLAGTPDELRTSLSSDPPLAEADLRSLIVTGRLASQNTGRHNREDEERTVVESISGDVFGFAAQAIGLDAVSIGSNPDLDLLASDIDARTSLNLTKSLSRQLQLVYSRDLQEDRSSWLVIYRPTRALSFRVLSRDNRDGAVEFRQEIRFGAPPGASAAKAAARPKKPRVTSITFTGDRGVPDAQLFKVLQLAVGDRFDTWRWRGETERLARFYRERSYFTTRIVPRRDVDGDGVKLEYAVTRGPRTTLAINGHAMPPRVIEAMRDAWAESVSTAFLLEDLERVARTHLIDEGYLSARVRAEVPAQTPAAVAVLVHVTPGPRVASRQIDPAGVSPAMRDAWDEYLKTSGLDQTAWYDPPALKGPLEAFYRDRSYLDVSVVPGDVQIQGTTARLPVAVSEGPQYRLAKITVDGADVLGVERVQSATGVTPGTPWQAAFVSDALKRVENAYHSAGFPDTEVYVEPQIDRTAQRVTLYVAVAEGQRQVLQDLTIEGTHATLPKTVSDLVNLTFGSPVTPALVSDVQKRLYDVGVFSRVLVDFLPAPGGSQATSVHDDPVIAKVTVFEAPRYSVQYGLQVSRTIQATSTESEYKPGGAIDFRDRNFLGRALGLGVGVRADAREQSGRMTLTMPRTYGTSIRSFLFLDRSKESSIPETGYEETDNNASITVEQRWRRTPRLEFSWGLAYDFRDVGLTQVGSPPIPVLDLRGDTFGPRLAAVWDSRDDPFDSKRGFFHSFGFDLGVPQIGSDLAYTRFLVQNFLFVPKGPLVFASAARYGGLHAWGPDNPIELDLLFDAGGSRSVRGYAEDALAAVEIGGVKIGGRQMLVFNQEVRFPIWWWFKGATFVDAGNTFAHAADVRLGALKVGAGWGLRLATPLALIRFDVGYPVNDGTNHRPRYYFTIGQAF